MLAELFRRLRPFGTIESYKYVGFGSVWFSDFILFHRVLGISKMLSIEKSSGSKARFDANRPFKIDMDYSRASDALKKLTWRDRHFIWLDYDGVLDTEILSDARFVASKATTGTALVISTQCNQAAQVDQAEDDPAGGAAIDRFRQTFGPGRVQDALRDEDLYGWTFGALSRTMLVAEIQEGLAARNIGDADPVKLKVVCNINYKDDAKMSTIVVVFYKRSDQKLLDDCHFASMDFLPKGQDTITIDLPKLTVRELRYLEAQLPLNGNELNLGAIPLSDAEKFVGLYRYFPNFAVTEL
jgi:hypothetical protein